jgi:putative inorganic carbon (hco3(-)) transporter
MIHFGLSSVVPYVLYGGGVAAFLLSIFWRPIVGLYYLVPLIPLQTARYYLIGFPFGQSMVDIILFGTVVGMLIRQRPIFPSTPWNLLLVIYCAYTFISLCLGSFYLHRPLPLSLNDPRLADWKNYMVMPLILFVVAAATTERRQIRVLLLLMLAAIFLLNRGFWDTVSDRDFSSFSYDLRDEGGMGYAGVNGFAAFEAQAATFLVALSLFEKRWLLRLIYLSVAGFSVACLMYSLSRGGYLAFLVGCLFLGIVKQRKLLVLLAVFLLTWTSLVPRAVQQRVYMTYDQNSGELDHSAAMRVSLWEEAKPVFDSNPVFGSGFDTYAYTDHINGYRDTHNIFVKVLVETGVAGLFLFLWILVKTFGVGYRLFREAQDDFLRSLGLGLSVWVICVAAANLFGDRWTFLQVNGYMWVLGGLVFRALELEANAASVKDDQPKVSDVAVDAVAGSGQEPLPAVL